MTIRDQKVYLDEVTKEQYIDSLGVNLSYRWEFYKRAETPDPRDEVIDQALQSREVVLDVGCGTGTDLLRLADNGFNGLLVGQEISKDAFGFKLRRACCMSGALIHLVVSPTASELPFADNSVDAMLAMFMLYHVLDPEAALKEFKRVLKPEGILVVGTSSIANKPEHRFFEKEIAEALGMPWRRQFNESFYSSFYSGNAVDMLEQEFEIDRELSRNWPSRFVISETVLTELLPNGEKHDSNLQVYMNSLLSMFPPLVYRQWLEAFNARVLPHIERSITEQGSFVDYINRQYFVCRPKS